MPTDVRTNPFAGLADQDDATPDPGYVADTRWLLKALCGLYAAGNVNWYADPSIDESAWLDAADHAGGAQ